MRTKEEYYEEIVLKNRQLAEELKDMKCSCPNTLCDWHGKCKECVSLHRYKNDHIPACLQPIISDKLKDLVKAAELVATKKQGVPIEHFHYMQERDKERAGA